MPVCSLPSAGLLSRAQEALCKREIDAALELFLQVDVDSPEANAAAAGRWECWMLKGQFEQAWKESDCLRKQTIPDPHRFWDGRSLHGRHVMLRCLHGFGDAIQMLRYAPQVRQIVNTLTVQVAPPLLELTAPSKWIDTVMTWEDPEPPWDLQIECMEIPYIFRTTLNSIPSPFAGLLCFRNSKEARRQERALNVGLVWNAGEWNPSRSIPLKAFEPLLQLPNIAFHNLQGGPAKSEWEAIESQLLLKTPPLPGGLAHLASAIAQMDLVITVDTLAAHLAGTIGVPVWLLLQQAADWRWMLDRNDSPWYPTMSLFRRGLDKSWDGLIGRIHHELKKQT